MLPPDLLLTFLSISVLITLAPGPDNLMVLSLGVSRGRAAGIGFGLGCAAGCVTHTAWATLGIGAAVMASPIAFSVLKLVGAAYLLMLGVQAWCDAGKSALVTRGTGDGMFAVCFRRGFLANAVNPKVALFFLAFLPQFADPSRGVIWLQMLLLGGLFAAQTVVMFSAIGWFSGSVGVGLSRNPTIAVWLGRVTALLFVSLALRLALADR